MPSAIGIIYVAVGTGRDKLEKQVQILLARLTFFGKFVTVSFTLPPALRFLRTATASRNAFVVFLGK